MNERTVLRDASPSPIRPLNRERLKAEFESAAPYPHIIIDEFLEPEFALKAAGAFPTFTPQATAMAVGSPLTSYGRGRRTTRHGSLSRRA